MIFTIKFILFILFTYALACVFYVFWKLRWVDTMFIMPFWLILFIYWFFIVSDFIILDIWPEIHELIMFQIKLTKANYKFYYAMWKRFVISINHGWKRD